MSAAAKRKVISLLNLTTMQGGVPVNLGTERKKEKIRRQ